MTGVESPKSMALEELAKLEVTGVTRPSPRQPNTPCEISNLDPDMNSWLDDALGSTASTIASSAKLYVKILVTNAAAGSIIGKAGGNINDFQSKTYARIQLSKASEYYPGTTERTLLVTGQLKHIIAALDLTFDKLLREGVAPLSPRSRPNPELGNNEQPLRPQSTRLLVRFLVPQALCGIIIGRGGSTIKTFSAETQTLIRLAEVETPHLQLSHRIVHINGTPENVLKAIALLILKQTEDVKYPSYCELPSSYLSPPSIPAGMTPIPIAYHGMAPAVAATTALQYTHPQFAASTTPTMYTPAAAQNYGVTPIYASASPDGLATITFTVVDDQATVLLGQDGHGLDELQSTTGVRVQIVEVSQDQSPSIGKINSRSMRITLTGHADAVQYCHYVISQKLMSYAYQQQYAVAAGMYPAAAQYHAPNIAGGHYNGAAAAAGGAAGYYQYRPQFVPGGNLRFSNVMESTAAMNGRRPSPRTITPRQQSES